MRLEALELVKRREIRVFVVEVEDEADRYLVVFQMIEEGAAAGAGIERPAEAVLDEALLVLFGRDLPQLLQADAELRRIAALVEFISGDKLFGERAAHAFADEDVLAHKRHAARVVRALLAGTRNPHIARRHADDPALVVIEHLGGCKAGIDFHAQFFRLAGKPAADVSERYDVGTVIVHQRRHHEVRQAHRAGRPQHHELVLGDGGLQRCRVILAPVRDQPVERNRIDHGSGQDVGTDLRTLFQNDDRQLLARFHGKLFETDRRGQARRAGPHDHHVEFHALALGQSFAIAHVCQPPIRSLPDFLCSSFRLCLNEPRWCCNALG